VDSDKDDKSWDSAQAALERVPKKRVKVISSEDRTWKPSQRNYYSIINTSRKGDEVSFSKAALRVVSWKHKVLLDIFPPTHSALF
jgi:hypothetical protein